MGQIEAINACACQRNAGETLMAPTCAPEIYTGNKDEGFLFVKRPDNLACSASRSFSYGDFCLCSQRIDVYLNFGI